MLWDAGPLELFSQTPALQVQCEGAVIQRLRRVLGAVASKRKRTLELPMIF